MNLRDRSVSRVVTCDSMSVRIGVLCQIPERNKSQVPPAKTLSLQHAS